MPCAFPSSASDSVYRYNDVPAIDFFQFTDGSAAPVAPVAPDAPTAPVAPVTPETDETDSVVTVKKREANPGPGYIPQGYVDFGKILLFKTFFFIESASIVSEIKKTWYNT